MCMYVRLRGWRNTIPQDHVSGNLLTVITMFEWNGHGELDSQMTFQRIVDLERGDIDTASYDQFLQAT